MKRLVGVIVVVAIVAGAAWHQGFVPSLAGDDAPAEATLPPVKAPEEIQAEARVVPARFAALGLPAGGRVIEVLAAPAARVAKGDVLLRADPREAEARAARTKADLRAAEAAFTKVVTGASKEELEAAEAAIAVADAGVDSAAGAVAMAKANLAKLLAGPTAEELAIAESEVDQAKNSLWGAQSQRDAICGRVGSPGVEQADCDGAEATVGVASEAQRIATLQLQTLLAGAREEDVAAARSDVQQASGRLASARAAARQARAERDRVAAGPTAEDITQADARVQRAQAAYDQARIQLENTTLVAPFAGTVAALEVRLGEQAAPMAPLVQLADLSHLTVETEDLTELNVVRIDDGDPVVIRFDALPGVEMPGTVTRIEPIGVNKFGDITYTVTVEPRRQDPRLRWNMTATVVISRRQ